MKSSEQITLIAVGPLPNVAAALEREPNIAKKARFVGMHGSVRRGYGGSPKPQPEYNIAEFLKESQKVFTADWIDMTITPLDTCSLVILKGEKYKKVLDSNNTAAKIVIDNYRVWLKSSKNMKEEDINSRSSTLFDTVAVYLAIKTDLLEMENLGIRVTNNGLTAIDESARKVNCATKWKDLHAYEDFLVERLIRKQP
jgi:inosine-uridine nucleoside N-ribohydrolase